MYLLPLFLAIPLSWDVLELHMRCRGKEYIDCYLALEMKIDDIEQSVEKELEALFDRCKEIPISLCVDCGKSM